VTDVPQPGGPDDDAGDDDGRHDRPDRDEDIFGEQLSAQFGGIDFSQLDLGALMGMLHSSGPVNWDIAHQVAGVVALEGEEQEAPVAAGAASELQDLASAAESQVVAATGLGAGLAMRVRATNRREWADIHLAALKPVLEALAIRMREALTEGGEAEGLGPSLQDAPAFPSDPEDLSAMGIFGASGEQLAGIFTMLAPVLLGVQSGSMIGYLAQHALGRYDLPLPTDDVPTLLFVVPNLEAFESAWSLERRDLRFYLALHELLRAGQRQVHWVQERMVRLAVDYVSSYELDPRAFEEQFGNLDPTDPEAFSKVAEHPEAILGAMQSDRQLEVLASIQRYSLVLEGYADVMMERIGERMVPDFARIHEAIQRHHVERGEAGRFIEGLLGMRLDREHYELGQAFCRGVIERAGTEGLNRLWDDERLFPTPNELDAPGLWLARIDIPRESGDP
jgi:putative hydrolase